MARWKWKKWIYASIGRLSSRKGYHFDFLVTVIAVTVYSFIATPVYEASATLMVSEQGSGAQAMLFDGLGGMGKNSAQNYMQIMKVALSCRRYVGRWA